MIKRFNEVYTPMSWLFDLGEIKIAKQNDGSLKFYFFKLRSDQITNLTVSSGVAFLLGKHEKNEAIRKLPLEEVDKNFRSNSISYVIVKLYKLALGDDEWNGEDLKGDSALVEFLAKYETPIRAALHASDTVGDYLDGLRDILNNIKKDLATSRFDL